MAWQRFPDNQLCEFRVAGVLGLICAAMGVPKGSAREGEVLGAFADNEI